jgi:hypothetical protein
MALTFSAGNCVLLSSSVPSISMAISFMGTHLLYLVWKGDTALPAGNQEDRSRAGSASNPAVHN